jgi:hypothetical protein
VQEPIAIALEHVGDAFDVGRVESKTNDV